MTTLANFYHPCEDARGRSRFRSVEDWIASATYEEKSIFVVKDRRRCKNDREELIETFSNNSNGSIITVQYRPRKAGGWWTPPPPKKCRTENIKRKRSKLKKIDRKMKDDEREFISDRYYKAKKSSGRKNNVKYL